MDISSGISSDENNIRQSFFVFLRMVMDVEVSENVNWFAVIGVVLGAVVANLVHWGIASINGMVVAAVCYLIGRAVEKK